MLTDRANEFCASGWNSAKKELGICGVWGSVSRAFRFGWNYIFRGGVLATVPGCSGASGVAFGSLFCLVLAVACLIRDTCE